MLKPNASGYIIEPEKNTMTCDERLLEKAVKMQDSGTGKEEQVYQEFTYNNRK